MANTTVNIDIQVQSKSLVQLEEELAGINAELKKVPIGSDAFKELSKDAQKVTAELDKVNNEVKGFTFDDKIRSADGAVKLLGGSLAATVGTLGVLGVESEAFGEFEKKAASAIAVAVGFKDVSEGISQLGPFFKQAGAAAKGFGITTKQAIIATGIGVFVVALGTIIAYWDDIVAGVEKFGEKVPFVGKAIDTIKQAFNSLVDAFRPVLEFLGLMPTQAEAAAEAVRKGAEASVGPLTQEIALLKARKAAADEIFEAEKKLLQARITGAKDEEERLKAQNELAVLIAANNTRIAEEREQKRKEAAEKAKQDLEQRKANEKEAFDFLVELQEQEKDLLAKTDEEKLALQQERILKEIDALKVSEEEKATIRLQAEENYNIQLQELKDKQAEEDRLKTQEHQAEINDVLEQMGLARIEDVFERAKAELKIEEEKEIARLQAIGATEAQIAQVKAYYADQNAKIVGEQTEWEKMNADMRRDFVIDAAAQTFGNLAAILGEQSKAGKAAAIGEAIIKTYQAANAAYASLAVIPIVGPALGAVAAAAAVVAGIANVKKIKATKVPGGDGGGPAIPSTISAPGLTTASSNVTPNQAIQAPQSQNIAPTFRAYVLSGDVTSSQEADAKLSRKRTIAG